MGITRSIVIRFGLFLAGLNAFRALHTVAFFSDFYLHIFVRTLF